MRPAGLTKNGAVAGGSQRHLHQDLTLKIANHQKPEVDAGGQSQPSHLGRIRLGTDFLDKLVELVSHQNGIEVFAERMGRWFRDLTGRNPLFVSLAPVSGASFEGLFEHPGR